MMTMGISTRMYGMTLRMWLPIDGPFLSPFLYIWQYNVLVALWSTCDRSSATHEYLEGGFFSKQYTLLLLSRSWAMMTFSLPLITKYPPWSYVHSPSSVNSWSVFSFNTQNLDRSMIGTIPMNTLSSCERVFSTTSSTSSSLSILFRTVSSSFCRWYFAHVTSTYSGAEYTRSRRRASFGNIADVLPSTSVIVGLLR